MLGENLVEHEFTLDLHSRRTWATEGPNRIPIGSSTQKSEVPTLYAVLAKTSIIVLEHHQQYLLFFFNGLEW